MNTNVNIFKSKHDNKYRYLYKITNVITGQYYYGIHTTTRLNDNYMGSGKRLKKDQKILGIDKFKKEYIEFFEDDASLCNAERNLVNIKLLNDPLCYNIICGGGDVKGTFPIRNTITGEIKAKSINEEYDKNIWVHITTGRKCIHKNINGVYVYKYVYKEFIQQFLDDGWILGSIGACTGKIKINNGKKVKYIIETDLQKYLNEGWQRGGLPIACKGNIRIINADKTKEKLIKPCDLQKYLNEGWQRGSIHAGRIHIYRNENEHKMVYKHELDKYLSEGWVKGSNDHSILGKIKIINGDKCIVIDPVDFSKYESLGWVKGSKATVKNKIVINKNNENKFVNYEELDKYLSEGWVKGSWISSCKGRIYINKDNKEKIIKPEELDKYLSEGWVKGKVKKTSKN